MVNQNEIYSVLTYRWQTGRDVRQRLTDEKNIPREKIGLGVLYAGLQGLVDEGLAEMRQREPTSEESKKRGSNRVSEYRKLDCGIVEAQDIISFESLTLA